MDMSRSPSRPPPMTDLLEGGEHCTLQFLPMETIEPAECIGVADQPILE